MPPTTLGKGNALKATESLEYLINHVFLPPKTPQEDDMAIEQEHNLISSLLSSVKKFSKASSATESKALGRVVRMLERLLQIRPGLQDIKKTYVMKNVIGELKHGGTLCFLWPCFFPLSDPSSFRHPGSTFHSMAAFAFEVSCQNPGPFHGGGQQLLRACTSQSRHPTYGISFC